MSIQHPRRRRPTPASKSHSGYYFYHQHAIRNINAIKSAHLLSSAWWDWFTVHNLRSKNKPLTVAWWDWFTHANRTIDCYLLVANKIGIIAIFIMAILLYNWWQLIVLILFTLILSSLIKTVKQ